MKILTISMDGEKMVEDIKTLVDRLIKNLAVIVSRQDNSTILGNKEEKIVYTTLRDLIVVGLDKAGKSKDELIKLLGQEIGMALAAVLKEPLSLFAESKKLQITIELVPKATKKTKKIEGKFEERKSLNYDESF